MLSLPDTYRGIAPDQRGFGAADPAKKIDATRGMADLADDALVLLDHLGLARAHLVGNSMGGSVVWRLLNEGIRTPVDGDSGQSGLSLWFRRHQGCARPPLLRRFRRFRRRLDDPRVLRLRVVLNM